MNTPRSKLQALLDEHIRQPDNACSCGAVALGQSWSDHVLDLAATDDDCIHVAQTLQVQEVGWDERGHEEITLANRYKTMGAHQVVATMTAEVGTARIGDQYRVIIERIEP